MCRLSVVAASVSVMTQTPGPESAHPVLVAAARIEAALKETRDVDPGFMRAEEKRAALGWLVSLRDRLDGLFLSVVAASGEVAEEAACRDVAAWLVAETLADRSSAGAVQRLAGSLAGRWRRVADGVRDGVVSIEQARVICRCLDALFDAPPEPGVERLDPEVLARAEVELVRLAQRHTPGELRRLGERIVALVAPWLGEERDRRALEAAERRASAATRLGLRRRGDGSTDLHARIPDAVAARLRTYLDAYTSPRTQPGPAAGPVAGSVTDAATGARVPRERLLGEAFCALLEGVPAAAMPLHGGSATTVVVTVDLEALRSGLGVATTGDGTRISAAQARRLACNAAILPMVLGGASQPLDLGRSRRLFSTAQRLALAKDHPTCRAQGCTVPATWCEAHHAHRPWSAGGRTDLAEGKLLCSWHHHRAHDDRYEVDHLPNGDIRFHRRR